MSHILDLIISRYDSSIINSVNLLNEILIEHILITSNLNFSFTILKKVKKSFRKLKNIDLDSMKSSINYFNFPSNEDINEMVKELDIYLSNVIDDHAPLISKLITDRPHAPWYSDDLRLKERETFIRKKIPFCRRHC